MEDSWHLNTEISNKLQREMENLAVLQDSLKRSDAMTKNMLGILDSFESRLGKLEETIMPIYKETGNLQRRHENSEKTLAALDHVIGYYHVAEEVEPVIRDGPASSLSNYMQCMDKLRKAVQYLTVNNPDSPQLSHVMTLYEAGMDAMEKEFRNLLARHGKPVPPGSLLDVLALDYDAADADGSSMTVLEQLPESVLQNLRQIAAWMVSCGHKTDFMDVYATVRSPLLVRSLQTLREHLKSASKDSGLGLTHSPALSSKQKIRDTPVRKASKRMAFVRKSSSTVSKRTSNFLEPPALGRQSGGSVIKDELCEVDIDFYVTSVLALLKLIQSEATLMQGIVPERQQRKIFDQLIQSGLDMVVKEGEVISQFIQRSIQRHNIRDVIHLFPVLRQLRAVKPEFDITLEGCQAPTRTKLASLISILDTTGARALEEFIDNIRNDPDKSFMPKDGTVHQLTSNTILFLEHLLDFADTAGAMLLTQDPTSLPNVQNVDRLKLKLAEFLTKVLSSLGLNLNNKAEAYSDTALKAIFMLNNFTYILKALRRSRMLNVVHMWNDEVEAFYSDQIVNQKRIYSQSTSLLSIVVLRLPDIEKSYLELVRQHKGHYMQGWSRVLHYVAENQQPCSPTSIPADMKLKDKDRNMIKERFVGFNREVEEIHRIQRAFAIPDAELRETLRSDNKEFILPFYRNFLSRYRSAPFSRHPEKYIKYSDRDVERFINDFFDAAS